MPSTILLFQPADEIIPEILFFKISYKYWDVCSKRYGDFIHPYKSNLFVQNFIAF